ncbi:SH3 domain-containing protein [Blautia sp. MSJ-9]|uniref:SH3 domain-containing protein n=1 Tax=Blautia sp. MSJ-9 TaxID=2841511 RepID=UPI001C11B7DC|nr:SH3 domain-containing protein [Blautia sp. MSJ-9]MBU5680075.1 SH3 domain-containing protein [Blautia sp. MSJ-9]
MNEIKVKIGKNGTYTNVTKLVKKVTVAGRRGDAPRTLTAILSDSEQYTRATANSGEGQNVFFYSKKKELFRGILMTDNRSNKRTLSIKAYDNCIYLCNNKGNFSFKNKTATYIFQYCLKQLGLPLGAAANTVYVIGELIKKNTTYWDVIEDALSQTYYATGIRYYVSSEKGKIYLRKRREQTSMPLLSLDTNIKTYEMSRSIYNTRTRLTLITSKGNSKGSTIDSALEKKIGRFSDIESVDEDITQTEINQRIKTFKMEKGIIDKDLKVSATGDTRCVSGKCAYVKISPLGVERIMFIEEDTHTFENGHHTMDLKLSYDKTSGTSSGGSSSSKSKSGGNKYKVTANSGLNLRSGPNAGVIATIPHGETVTWDGKSEGSWYHVQYNGTWGYASSSWLEKA